MTTTKSSQQAQDPPRFMSADDVTKETTIAKATLAKWRWNGNGPPWCKCGARVVYSRDDLDAWIASNTRSPAGANDNGGANP